MRKKPERILLFEDDENIAEPLSFALSNEGFNVIYATEGREGMAHAEAPDAILLDVILPGMDGLKLCKTLRKEDAAPESSR